MSIPDIVPTNIPPPNTGQIFREQDFSGVGVIGGKGDGKPVDPNDAHAPDVNSAPHFTPMTEQPRLLNGDEVARALERSYPPLLRDAGIGGTVVMWFYIDEDGTVRRRQVYQKSGYDALDQAADKVFEIMKFSPAKNRDKKVPVWVQIPINFKTK